MGGGRGEVVHSSDGQEGGGYGIVDGCWCWQVSAGRQWRIPFKRVSLPRRWWTADLGLAPRRDWSIMDGWCFRNLIVGKASTLNFYQAINTTGGIDSHRKERVEAMSVFKRFVNTAQRDFVHTQRLSNPLRNKRFKGYANKRMEVLRQGIGPENITAAAYIQPEELPIPLLLEEVNEIQGCVLASLPPPAWSDPRTGRHPACGWVAGPMGVLAPVGPKRQATGLLTAGLLMLALPSGC